MAYTQAHLDALQQALASGELRVRFADREVTYRSVEELKNAIAIVKAGLEVSSGTRIRQHRVYTDKGF